MYENMHVFKAFWVWHGGVATMSWWYFMKIDAPALRKAEKALKTCMFSNIFNTNVKKLNVSDHIYRETFKMLSFFNTFRFYTVV